MKRTKAIVLFSGGLDSILATKMMQEQKVEPICICFKSPFFSCEKAKKYFKQLKIKKPLKIIKLGKDYIELIKKPKYGYGSALNPCIDCRIFMLKKAKQIMKKEKADFVVTGEVLNERPMSQTKNNLILIEKESGLQGKILRPLSAKLLQETEAEKKGFVDRSKLLSIHERQRKIQIALAKKYKISYPTPAGGCLLCEKLFGKKLKDLFKNKKKIESRDIELLKLGRHFHYKKSRIIVGRNEKENKKLMVLAKDRLIFEVKNWPSPITIIKGKPNKKAIEIAASLTISHSDAKNKKNVTVLYGKGKLDKLIKASSLSKKKIDSLRV